ncbi:hypothetical protein [Clostridium perfringens]|uniref:hypothetical protein n=1 Tax=Clostridium perfringens TaxID=1502 RepID=UPI0024BC47BC|nr:hypothetical protein [Clostridium perfringens]
MRKKILGLLVVGALSLGLVGCGGVLENNIASERVDETKSNYVVINYSGGKIVDVWTLENFNVQTLLDLIKCEFVDDNGNHVFVLGDVLVIGCKDDKEFSKYKEFHETVNE